MYLCTKIIHSDMTRTSLPQGVKLIQLPHNVDERGHLSYGEGKKDIPFEIRRIFWISGVPADKTRGGHAHWTCDEVVFPVAGSFEIEVDDGDVSATVLMNDSRTGILIPAGIWCELRHFEPGTVCVVAASQAYDATGYVHERSAWLRMRRALHNNNV